MEITKIAALAMVGACMAVLLKEHKPVFGMVTAMATTGILLFFILPYFLEITDYLRKLYEQTERNGAGLSGVLKITGITCIAQMAEHICKDAGLSSAAFAVALAGKLICICLCIPTVSAVFSLLTELVPGG